MPQVASSRVGSESRDREALLLVDLVRLSPATLLLAESDSDKSTFLEASVMPLLVNSAAGETEICLLFDRWTEAPLPALLAQIRRALPPGKRGTEENAEPASLAETLAQWQASVGATFIIILDRFEEHLAATERPGAPEFEDELVRALTMHELRAHFVIALDEHAAPLLERLRGRIPGFGDTVIRLPRPGGREAPQSPVDLMGTAPKHEPLVGSAAPVERSGKSEEAAPLRQPELDLIASEGGAVGSSASLDLFAAERAAPPQASAAAAERTRESRNIAETAPPEPQRHSDAGFVVQGRLPRAAWTLLGLLIASALGVLLLTLWQPNAPGPGTANEAVPAEPRGVVATSPDTTAGASTQPTPVASPADDQVALPLIKDEVPRAPTAARRQAKAAAPHVAPAAAPPILVYVHVRSEAQRAWAEQLKQPLAARGVRVVGIRVVRAGPSAADLRFFRPEEAREAAHVARVLREVGLPQPTLKRVSGLEKRSTRRQYELWLPPGSPGSMKQRR